MPEPVCPCRLTSTDKIALDDCCGPILEGIKAAATAEALMRSRYTAFAVGNIDYLETSLAPEARHDFDRKAIAHWAKQSQWLGLDILSTEAGAPGDKTGYVEFVAHFINDGQRLAHRERSLFRFDEAEGRWYFVEDANRKSAPVVKGAQPGRNDPCNCGSGKKYKKCCGLAA
jgi:SEC-C motif domain protein